MVFRLKHCWNFFSNSGSLWVAWLHHNVFRRRSFWLTDDNQRFSPAVRSMLQLKHVLSDFLRCIIGDGNSASFWYDVWTDFGPLISFVGLGGPNLLRLSRDARVSHATREGEWFLPRARSEEIQALQIALTSIDPPSVSKDRDQFRWRTVAGRFASVFSSKATWEYIREHSPTVVWHKIVWFKEEIPRCSFITWLAMLSRLPTRDRLRSWGMTVPDLCVLCSSGIESHQHLFFGCPFSVDIWSRFVGSFLSTPPRDLSSVIALLQQALFAQRSPASVVMKLLFQVIVYHIWKERNARIFTDTSITAAAVFASVDRFMKDRLLSFPSSSVSSPSFLELYFCFIGPFS